MLKVESNIPADSNDIIQFISSIDFAIPEDFINFYKKADGASFLSENLFVNIWPVTKLIEYNEGYNVNDYAPGFFFFGSDGGGTAFGIEKKTGAIFEIPFIGMPCEDAEFRSANLQDFLDSL